MSNSPSAARLERVRELIKTRELDQLLVTNLVNVKYLSGFSGTNGTLLIGPDDAILLTDFRYVIQAAEQSPEYELIDGGSEPRKTLAAKMHGRVGFDDADMRVQAHANLLKELAEGVELVTASGAIEGLREVKDANEIAAIARAATVADGIYAALAEEGLIGRSEAEVAWRIEVLAREGGASGLSFPSIVASGAHGALPHAEPRDVKIEPGQLVVLDLGVVVDGYCSDATRTFATGELSQSAIDVYEIVKQAQLAALEVIAVGAKAADVDAAAREYITAAGHGEHFGHSTGHGVGIEVHEGPTISSRSEAILEPGNIITVEPGIYLDGELGVRIEDLVVVEADGPRILTPFTKDLTTVG